MTEAAEAVPEISHNETGSRFETTVKGQLATACYTRDGEKITFTHTNVPEPYGGRGIGNALAGAALDFALRENLSVVPQCAFIAAYVERHPEYSHLVSGGS